jgi:hypothetical protein
MDATSPDNGNGRGATLTPSGSSNIESPEFVEMSCALWARQWKEPISRDEVPQRHVLFGKLLTGLADTLRQAPKIAGRYEFANPLTAPLIGINRPNPTLTCDTNSPRSR